MSRAAQAARRRTSERARQIAAEAETTLPRGVAVERVESGVRFAGRGLRRRFLTDPALRWLTERRR